MTVPSNKPNHSHDYLYQLSIEQLEKLLQLGSNASYAQDNEDYVDAIVQVILQKENENPTGRLADVDKSWQDFKTHYNSPEGEGQSLYPDEDANDTAAHSITNQPISVVPERCHRHQRVFYKFVAVAAILGVLFAGMIAAQACGLNVFGAIAKWTDSVFHFESPSGINAGIQSAPPESHEDNSFRGTMQSALDDSGISMALTPSWYPVGFEMAEPEISENDIATKVFCSFSSQTGRAYSIRFWKYVSTSEAQSYMAEKDTGDVELYTSGERTFYIMTNNGTNTATSSDGLTVVSITGDIPKEDIKLIINSIGGI